MSEFQIAIAVKSARGTMRLFQLSGQIRLETVTSPPSPVHESEPPTPEQRPIGFRSPKPVA